MIKKAKPITDLTLSKRIKISIFLIGIIVSFSILMILLFLQDGILIELYKSLYQKIIDFTNSKNLNISDFIIPIIKSFRENNTYIFICMGGVSVLLSGILSIIVSNIFIGKKKILSNEIIKKAINRIKNYDFSPIPDEGFLKESESSKEIIDTLNETIEFLRIDIEKKLEESSKSKMITMEKSIDFYKSKIDQLENEKNDIFEYLEKEKEKNEILFSQIEKMKLDYDQRKLEILSNEEKSIDNLLNKILNNKPTENTEESGLDLFEENGSYENGNSNVDKNQNHYKIKSFIQNPRTENIDDNLNDEESNSREENIPKSLNLLKIYNKNILNIYNEIKTLCKIKEYKKALEICLNDLSEKERRMPKFAYLLGYICSKLNKNQEAKKYLAIVLSVDPNNIDARNIFGVIQYRIGNKRDAEQQFNMVIILDPQNKIAKENLKRIRMREEERNSLSKVIA